MLRKVWDQRIYLPIPKLQQLQRRSLEMDSQIHDALYKWYI